MLTFRIRVKYCRNFYNFHHFLTGNFLQLDPKTFEPKGKWPIDGEGTKFGYDFWFQPRHNVRRGKNMMEMELSYPKVMISTGWGNPAKFRKGFWPSDVANGGR